MVVNCTSSIGMSTASGACASDRNLIIIYESLPVIGSMYCLALA